ncbi:MAG: glycosyltransferase family 1 protein [Candidatus Gracilibacteria bacterium]|jgi:glycosyltransferase involved in cell wall biosynthesis
MKIGIDCRMYSSSFTGIGRYVFEIVENFIKIIQNENAELVLFFNNPQFKQYNPPSSNIKKILVDCPHYSLKEQIKFLKILNKENCDIVHFPHFNIPILYNKPYVVTIHDLTLSHFPGKKLTKFYHRLAYNMTIKNAVKKAKKIIAVSQNTKTDIINLLHIEDKKIEVIYNGVGDEFKMISDPILLHPVLKKYNIKKQFLLYTGVWRNHKNLPNLIKAFSILKNKHHLDFNLVITGKEDPYYPEVKNTVASENLKDDVIFTGLVNDKDLIALYNAAFIYVFPSLYEGFGLPPLESMKCGTPVVASNTSSIPEICGEENALFFDPYDITDIADKILKLTEDVDLQADLIEKGLVHADTFRWEDSAQKTYGILKIHLKK